MIQSPTVDKIIKVFEKCQLWFQQTYSHQSEELRIWFVIGVIAASVLAILMIGLLLQKTLNRMNSWMRTDQGWEPIRFSSIMWAGSGIWAIISLIWLTVARIGLLKALAASTVNFGAGAIIAPIVIQFGMFAIVIAVALLALFIWASLQPPTVYVKR